MSDIYGSLEVTTLVAMLSHLVSMSTQCGSMSIHSDSMSTQCCSMSNHLDSMSTQPRSMSIRSPEDTILFPKYKKTPPSTSQRGTSSIIIHLQDSVAMKHRTYRSASRIWD